jgi:ATP synthase protein I
MTDIPDPDRRTASRLAHEVGRKAARRLQARRDPAPGVWFGLGMMGLIGWSVTVPSLLGLALGLWLDQRYPGAHAWTLALFVGGLTLGCFNAWRWVAREDRAINGAPRRGVADADNDASSIGGNDARNAGHDDVRN